MMCHLYSGEIFFNLGWFSISFVSYPWLFMSWDYETKEIENQAKLKTILTWI